MAAKSLIIQDGTLGYRERRLLGNFNLKLSGGVVYFLCGENGVGKTTLIRALAGLHGLEAGIRRSTFARHGLVPQSTAIDSEFPLTIGGFLDLYGCRTEHAAGLCAEFGIQRLDLPLRHCSGGELQKALLVRCLALGCDFLAIDEPSALDARGRAALRLALRGLAKNGGCAVVCTHETPDSQKSFRAALITIRDGEVFLSGDRGAGR